MFNTFLKTLFLVSLIFQASLVASIDTFFDQFKYAYENNNPFPLISKQQSSFNLNMAYSLQEKWTDFLSESNNIIGYKAGLTSIDSQKNYNINSPVSGVLLSTYLYNNFDAIDLNSYSNPLLEIEVGFYFKTDITKTIYNTNTLKNYISKVVCVIEIPDINVEQKNELNVIDLVSINSASKGIIIGEAFSKSNFDKAFEINMVYNKKLIETIKLDNLLDSQLESLLWLVNHIINIQGRIKKDKILITGAINDVKPLRKGRYTINYGDTSSILFHTY